MTSQNSNGNRGRSTARPRRTLLRCQALIVLAGLLWPASTARAGHLYGVSTSTDSVYSINPTTGAATLITPIVAGGGDTSFAGAEVIGGKLYVTNSILSLQGRFGSVNLQTGAFTPLNTQGGSDNWWGLAVDSNTGRVYSVRSDNAGVGSSFPLVYTDTSGAGPTTVADVIGLSLNQGVGGLAHDDTNGILYGIGQDRELYTISKTTAAATHIGATGISQSGSLAGLAYDQQTGTLYLTARTSSGLNAASALYTVNKTTGAATLVGATGINTIDGLAWSPVNLVPEPSSWLLGVFGCAVLGMLACRRKIVRQSRSAAAAKIGIAALLAVTTLGRPAQAAVIVASTEDRTAAQFAPFTGTFTQLNGGPGDYLLAGYLSWSGNGVTNEEQRFAMDFDLLGLPAVVDATLRFTEITDDNGNTQLHGYAGDGSIELSDFEVSTLLVGGIDDGVVGSNEIDVTAFIQQRIASADRYAGFMVRTLTQPDSGDFASTYRIWGSNEFNGEWGPVLIINASVPEPSTLALGTCAAALGMLARRRRCRR